VQESRGKKDLHGEHGGHRERGENGEAETDSVRVDNKKALTTGESIRKNHNSRPDGALAVRA